MGKTVIGRAGRPLDVDATKTARARHALGKQRLDKVFNGNASPGTVAEGEAARRQTQGRGGSATKRHWTRPARRAAGRAQRAARRLSRR